MPPFDIRYDYESDWRPYVFPEPSARLATMNEIRRDYPPVELSHKPLKAGGMPVWSDGSTVCLNTRDEMTLGVGFTGAGKSRRGVGPTIAMLAKGGENIVAIDVKGELTTGSLARYIRGVLDENDYKTVFFDLRGFRGDGFNPLLLPYRMYREGKPGEALRLLHEQFNNLSHVYNGSTADPFWTLEGVLCLVGFCCGMFACIDDPDCIHMLSLAMLLNDEGCNAMHTIRERGIYTPVIVLSGLNEDGSMIRGYGLGADDYITKPFSSAVLASKIQALLRRSRVYTQEPEVRSELACGDFLLKLDIQKAFYQGRELALSSKEFSILCKLMERPGETIPKEQLYREVWNTDTFDQTKLLVYIKRIRDKIEEDSSEPKHLLTEWGRGYRFVP